MEAMKIYKEEEGIIRYACTWCCEHKEYLYMADTLPKLVWLIITEWNNDKHLVG